MIEPQIMQGNPDDFTPTDPSPDFCAALWLALREDDKEDALTGERKELFDNLTRKLLFNSTILGITQSESRELTNGRLR